VGRPRHGDGVSVLLRWVVLPVSVVVGLAAVLRMAGPAATPHDPLTGVIRLPRPVTATILGLFGVAALVLLGVLARRLRARRQRGSWIDALVAERPPLPAWLRVLTQILSLVNFVLVAYLIWRGVIPLTELLTLGGAAVSGLGAAAHEAAPAAPALVTWTFAILAVAAGLGALALALWLAFTDRLWEWWTRPSGEASPARRVSDVALADPRAEPDTRRAIMRCYAWFERTAADSGVARPPGHTPMEFMREVLRRLPGVRDAVPALTTLFELARFSGHALGPTERERALQALEAITASTASPRADAGER
jgi:hypothetical protein